LQRTLEREARGAQKLIIWTDCDREGENIGFEIIDVVTQGVWYDDADSSQGVCQIWPQIVSVPMLIEILIIK